MIEITQKTTFAITISVTNKYTQTQNTYSFKMDAKDAEEAKVFLLADLWDCLKNITKAGNDSELMKLIEIKNNEKNVPTQK